MTVLLFAESETPTRKAQGTDFHFVTQESFRSVRFSMAMARYSKFKILNSVHTLMLLHVVIGKGAMYSPGHSITHRHHNGA